MGLAANRTLSSARAFLPPLVTFGAVGMAALVVIDFVVSGTAPRTGNCFDTGSLGDQWVSGVSGVGLWMGAATILVALAGIAFARGRRLFCLGMGILAAGAGFMCFLFLLGEGLCE